MSKTAEKIILKLSVCVFLNIGLLLKTVILNYSTIWFRGGAGGHRPQIVARPPNLAVLLTHCGQFILRKITKFDATRLTSDFQAKIHKIRFQLRLHPRLR